MKLRLLLPVLLPSLAALWPAPARAQDEARWARMFGTPLPAGYWEMLEREPALFRFERALHAVGERARANRIQGPGPGGFGVQAVSAAPAVGVYRVPAVLALFSGGGAPAVTAAQLQRELFDGPSHYYKTATEFYAELSNGLFTLTGTVFDSARASVTLSQAMGSNGCLTNSDCRLGDWIHDVLEIVDDRGVDWGPFDNDGPDGVPNSGDDDGFVDVLAVFHPTLGGECGGPGPWARKTQLAALPAPRSPFTTSTASNRAGFGNIRVNDLIIQSALTCPSGNGVTEIGIFVHEFGHALGLPDLYDTVPTDGSDSQGIGQWGLMATGTQGCPGRFELHRPCHMSAWSKEQLGWVTVQVLPSGQDLGTLELGDVQADRVYRVDSGDGAREYYLLESRQPFGFNQGVPAAGLLVWHADQAVLDANLAFNRVNTNPNRYGVGLVEADGRRDLRKNTSAGANQGDAGDPFPGVTQNRAFHAGSQPAALTNDGWATGVTAQDIEYTGAGGVSRFRLDTRFRMLTLALDGADTARVTIDGRRDVQVPGTLPWAPFESRALEASAGGDDGNGVRRGFESWSDGPTVRQRTFALAAADSSLTLRYSKQFRLNTAVLGGPDGISPGSVALTPAGQEDGWFAPGTSVSARAEPRTGFAFGRWEGAGSGSGNPVTVVMDTARTLTAHFDQTFAVTAPGTTVALEATDSVGIELQAADGTPPYTWSLAGGSLPDGLGLRTTGLILGAPLLTGDFPLSLRVRDAIGLTASLDVTLRISAPILSIATLTAPLLGTPGGLNALQRQYLDRSGNANGSYDVGDLRAYLLENPNVPATAAERAVVRILIPAVRLPEGTP